MFDGKTGHDPSPCEGFEEPDWDLFVPDDDFFPDDDLMPDDAEPAPEPGDFWIEPPDDPDALE